MFSGSWGGVAGVLPTSYYSFNKQIFIFFIAYFCYFQLAN